MHRPPQARDLQQQVERAIWGERAVSKQDVMIFFGAGLVTWLAATLFYAAFGGAMLEASFWFYAANAFAVATGATLVFQAVARLRHIPRRQRLFPALAFALPGLLGLNVVLLNLADLIPGAEPATLGRYGAFLVVLYVAIGASVFERGAQKAGR